MKEIVKRHSRRLDMVSQEDAATSRQAAPSGGFNGGLDDRLERRFVDLNGGRRPV